MNPYLRISEIMSISVVSTGPDATVAEAAELMRSRDVGSVLVMEGPRLVGILTERDIVQSVADRTDPARASVERAMTRAVVTAEPDSHIVYAATLMAERGIRHLPVVQEDRAIGMVSIRDIVRWGLMALAWDPAEQDAHEALRMVGASGRR